MAEQIKDRKSIWALVAGVLVIIVVTTLVDILLHVTGVFPRWYPISLVVLAIPQCWAGGKIYEMQSGKR